MTTTRIIHETVLLAQHTVVTKATMGDRHVAAWLIDAYVGIREYLHIRGVEPMGGPFARTRSVLGQQVIEAGFVVAGPTPGNGYFRASMLPHCAAAISIHDGRYNDLDQTCAAIREWLALKNYAGRGSPWYVFLTDPTESPTSDMWPVEVVVPFRML